MLRRLRYSMFSFVLILIFSNTNILIEACDSTQITCTGTYPYYVRWCCQSYETCGTSSNVCYGSSSYTGDPVAGAIVGSIIIIVWCVVCASCCYWCRRRAIQSRQPIGGYVYTQPIQQPQYSYQQQPMQTAPTVTYTNPNAYPHTHTPTPIYNNCNYEKPPPSYEAASRDTRFTAPTPSAPPTY